MKITRLHYERLATAIRDFKALYNDEEWEECIRAYPRFEDWRITFIWAVYHAVTTDMTIRDMMVNGGYNDSHIETALKKILHDEVYP